MVTLKTSIRIAALVVSLLLIQSFTNSAEAGHRHHRHHFHHRHYRGFHLGWWSGYGSYGGFHHWGWQRPWYYVPRFYVPRYYYAPVGCYGLYGGGYGWAGRAPGYYGWSWLSSSDTQTPATMPVPREVTVPEETGSMVASSSTTGTPAEITLKVDVPQDARVFINGFQTSAKGSRRSYVANGTQGNEDYNFVVRAELKRDDRLITETKTVNLSGGQTSLLTFDLDAPEPLAVTRPPVNTTLKMRVPLGAKVYLAGYETRQTGEQRVYLTKRLRAGEQWEDYRIRVTWQEDGVEQTREENITLVAGETRELEFGHELRLAAAL